MLDIYYIGGIHMAKRKKRSGGKKRTISAEQQMKMQEGRRKAAAHKDRVKQLYESGVAVSEETTRTQRMLDSVRRKG